MFIEKTVLTYNKRNVIKKHFHILAQISDATKKERMKERKQTPWLKTFSEQVVLL